MAKSTRLVYVWAIGVPHSLTKLPAVSSFYIIFYLWYKLLIMPGPNVERYVPQFTTTLAGDNAFIKHNSPRIHEFFSATLVGVLFNDPQPPYVNLRGGQFDLETSPGFFEARQSVMREAKIDQYAKEYKLGTFNTTNVYSLPIGSPKKVGLNGYDEVPIVRRAIPLAFNNQTHRSIMLFTESDAGNPAYQNSLDGDLVFGDNRGGVVSIHELYLERQPETEKFQYETRDSFPAIKRVMDNIATLTLGAGYEVRGSQDEQISLPAISTGLYL